MKCPQCGNELEYGKLLCGKCGEEVKIVPEFDIELESKLSESIHSMLKEIAQDELTGEHIEDIERSELSSEDDSDNETDDIQDELRDCFPNKSISLNKKHKIAIAVIGAVITVALSATAGITLENERKFHSYDYQYQKAIACAAEDNYTEAIQYLERALAIHSEDFDDSLLLADYYNKNNQQQSAVLILQEILAAKADYEHKDEVYDLLLSIYEGQMDYIKMGEILKHCDVSRIVSKYNKYAALEPEFNKQGGEYDEIISITLNGNTQGFVYYTLNGSVPTTNSMLYETPILLESGNYTIRAKFVNMYGVESEVVTQNYYISISPPQEPVISLDSGTYDAPKLIEVFHDDNTKIYYTTDNSTPTKNSMRYTAPIEMPYGVSNFSFVAMNVSGLSSQVVSRTYHLDIQANFTTDLALQVLVNELWANGILADLEGHVPNKLGLNQYRVQTVANIDKSLYYIIYEEYIDTTGNVHDTSNIYAVDTTTADLFRAYKVDEGNYKIAALAF